MSRKDLRKHFEASAAPVLWAYLNKGVSGVWISRCWVNFVFPHPYTPTLKDPTPHMDETHVLLSCWNQACPTPTHSVHASCKTKLSSQAAQPGWVGCISIHITYSFIPLVARTWVNWNTGLFFFSNWSIHLNITYQKDHLSKLTPEPPISSLMCSSWSINRKLELVQHKETLSKQKKIANENDETGLDLEFDLKRSGLHVLIQLLAGSQLTLSCNQEKCEKEDCMFFAFVGGRWCRWWIMF